MRGRAVEARSLYFCYVFPMGIKKPLAENVGIAVENKKSPLWRGVGGLLKAMLPLRRFQLLQH